MNNRVQVIGASSSVSSQSLSIVIWAFAALQGAACADSSRETGVIDAAGNVDGSPADASSADGSPVDASSVDGGADASSVDGSVLDASPADAGAADANLADSALPDAAVDATPAAPVVTGVNYDLLPLGSRFSILGSDISTATDVSIGGIAQTNFSVVSPTELLIEGLDASTPLGDQMLSLTTPLGTATPISVSVIAETIDLDTWAHGATAELSLTGYAGLVANTAVTVGGSSQTVTVVDVSTMRIVLDDDAAGIGSVELAWDSAGVSAAPILVPVMHLVIGELDTDTPGVDTLEFVELHTGVANADLDAYILVLFSGNDDRSYGVIDLQGQSADAQGRFLIGSATVIPTPDLLLSSASNNLQNGADAIALYQGSAGDFPNGTAIRFVGLIDALVYDTDDADDAGLLAGLLGSASAVQINEDENNDKDLQSVSRCAAGRLDGSGGVWAVNLSSPGGDNVCP